MSTALVPASSFDLVPQAASLADQIARTDFAPAGLRGKPEAVMAAMLTGHEIGIGPMQALSEISVINGRPCMSAKLMRALVHRAGHDLWFEVKSNTKVTICARRADWPEDRVAKVTWTMDDAKAAGLSGGQNYRKYPRAMLAARATGEICRDNFADVLGGIGYTPEELSDGDLVADDDLVVESRADVAPPEYVAVLSRLQDQVPTRPFPEIEEQIERELGRLAIGGQVQGRRRPRSNGRRLEVKRNQARAIHPRHARLPAHPRGAPLAIPDHRGGVGVAVSPGARLTRFGFLYGTG